MRKVFTHNLVNNKNKYDMSRKYKNYFLCIISLLCIYYKLNILKKNFLAIAKDWTQVIHGNRKLLFFTMNLNRHVIH